MPTETERPIDVRPWMSEAERTAREYAQCCELRAAVLDDWNGAPGLRSPRLIYDTPFAERCMATSDCAQCPVFQAVGADDNRDQGDLRLRSTLCRATNQHHTIFPSQQPMLNCKTIPQYIGAFVAYIVQCCTTEDLLEAELDWVRGFRLVYDVNIVDDSRAIVRRERSMKTEIIHAVLAKFAAIHAIERIEITNTHVRKWLPGALGL